MGLRFEGGEPEMAKPRSQPLGVSAECPASLGLVLHNIQGG